MIFDEDDGADGMSLEYQQVSLPHVTGMPNDLFVHGRDKGTASIQSIQSYIQYIQINRQRSILHSHKNAISMPSKWMVHARQRGPKYCIIKRRLRNAVTRERLKGGVCAGSRMIELNGNFLNDDAIVRF